MLELRAINKTYASSSGPVRAVTNVSLKVVDGEFLAICGPSGCGKSTLMLMAGGLLLPDSGAVMLNGVDVYGLDPSARARRRAASIGFVFQQFHLVPYLSSLDNIRVPVIALGDKTVDATARAEELLRQFGLVDRRNHVPAKLSVGEQQRVALCRALFNRPLLVLADEPTGNLDPANAEVVLTCLAEYAAAGANVLMVTHDERASAKATRIIGMKSGALAA